MLRRRWQLVRMSLWTGGPTAYGRKFYTRKEAQATADWINERMRRVTSKGNPKGPLPSERWVVRRIQRPTKLWEDQ